MTMDRSSHHTSTATTTMMREEMAKPTTTTTSSPTARQTSKEYPPVRTSASSAVLTTNGSPPFRRGETITRTPPYHPQQHPQQTSPRNDAQRHRRALQNSPRLNLESPKTQSWFSPSCTSLPFNWGRKARSMDTSPRYDRRPKRLSKASKTSSSTTSPQATWKNWFMGGCFGGGPASAGDDHTTIFRGSSFQLNPSGRRSSLMETGARGGSMKSRRSRTRGSSYDETTLRRESGYHSEHQRRRRQSFNGPYLASRNSFLQNKREDQSGFLDRAFENAVAIDCSDYEDLHSSDGDNEEEEKEEVLALT